ncbi:MAG: hypothetical protein Q4B28_08575 [bacterium]|nr:hypothetical protein [bacterium]
MPRQTKMQKMKGLWNASLALGCVLLVGLGIYGLGKLNPVTSAPNDTSKLRVQGIDNIVQYLKEMEIYDPANPNDPTKKVVIGWDESLKGVVIKGDVNMESIVVRTSGDANTSPSSNEAQSSTVIGGTANRVFVDTDETTNKNLAIIAGNANRIENAGNAFIAGGNAVEVKNASNAAVVAASGSRIAGDQPKGEVAIIAGEGNAINGERINNAVIFAGKNSATSASNTVLIGNNIKAGDKQKIFVWSDADGEFAPGHSSAFYVNATKGSLGVNTNNPRVRADINGPLGIKTYQPNSSNSLPTVTPDWKG